MRTTISIPDDLLAQAKEVAARAGRSLSGVIEDALREAFARMARPPQERFALPTFTPKHSPGLMPGVDLDSNAALLALMEEDDSSV
jgi:hypothetical protein